jgi:hypothetical protein
MFEQYRLAIYGAVIVAAIFAVIAYGSHKYSAGYDAAETKHKLEISQANEKAQADLIAAETKYREAEQKQAADFSALASTYDKKLRQSEYEKNAAIDRDLANGLYASVTTCEDYTSAVSKTGTDTSRVAGTYRARLSDSVTRDLNQLVTDCDKSAISYNTARDLLDSQRK